MLPIGRYYDLSKRVELNLQGWTRLCQFQSAILCLQFNTLEGDEGLGFIFSAERLLKQTGARMLP